MQSNSHMQANSLNSSYKLQKIIVNSEHLKNKHRIHALAITLIPSFGVVTAIAIALHSGIGLVEVGLLLLMYLSTMIGISVGFHRYFSHCTFKTSTPIRVLLAIIGSMACQGPLIYWVSNHRRHHQYSDQVGDVHSPYFKGDKPLNILQGLWYSQIEWAFNHEITNTFLFSKDLLQDSLISKVNQMYYIWILLGLMIPTILGGLITKTWMGAFLGFLWGGLVRLFLTFHATNSINSITHIYGKRPFNTHEKSTNNIWLALPTSGESWHNNHHAFPNSAKFGLYWWQIDIGYWFIRLLELTGLIWDVKIPTQEMIEAKKIA
jgi:stearoyl-CoA desaturase (delta-9 desaturase)